VPSSTDPHHDPVDPPPLDDEDDEDDDESLELELLDES